MGSPKGVPELELWVHDVLLKYGTPYDREEIKVVETLGKETDIDLSRQMKCGDSDTKHRIIQRHSLDFIDH